jgi:hypothetical protein
MRHIQLLLISLVVFFLLFTAISFLFPSHIRISKAVDINSSKENVMRLLKDTASWKNWYPGADSVKLNVTIVSATDSSVTAENNSGSKLKAKSVWNIFETGTTNTVTVQWYMDFYTGWLPWQKFSGLLLEGRYGPVLEKGLENLKKAVVAK